MYFLPLFLFVNFLGGAEITRDVEEETKPKQDPEGENRPKQVEQSVVVVSPMASATTSSSMERKDDKDSAKSLVDKKGKAPYLFLIPFCCFSNS